MGRHHPTHHGPNGIRKPRKDRCVCSDRPGVALPPLTLPSELRFLTPLDFDGIHSAWSFPALAACWRHIRGSLSFHNGRATSLTLSTYIHILSVAPGLTHKAGMREAGFEFRQTQFHHSATIPPLEPQSASPNILEWQVDTSPIPLQKYNPGDFPCSLSY